MTHQQRMIAFVSRYSACFATPLKDGSVYIYTRFTRGDYHNYGKVDVRRQRAVSLAECRRVLGF